MSDQIRISPTEVAQFLREKYGTVTEITQLEAGGWSHAYSFVYNNMKYVIRWSDVSDNFDRDAFAARFNTDGLPVPQIVEMGQAHGLYFAISPFVGGAFLEKLSAPELTIAVPSVLKMLRALRRVDLSNSIGYGPWNGNGNAAHRSWQEFLLDDKNESEGSLLHGWKENLKNSPIGTEVYDRLREKFVPLVDQMPEDRSLVHSDLINRNVLIQSGQIVAVLDWGSSFYGDSLYEVAWFAFYEPWYPQFTEVALIKQLMDDYRNDPTTDKTNIEARMKCYFLDIAINSIAYTSYKKDWTHTRERAEYAMKLTG